MDTLEGKKNIEMLKENLKASVRSGKKNNLKKENHLFSLIFLSYS